MCEDGYSIITKVSVYEAAIGEFVAAIMGRRHDAHGPDVSIGTSVRVQMCLGVVGNHISVVMRLRDAVRATDPHNWDFALVKRMLLG